MRRAAAAEADQRAGLRSAALRAMIMRWSHRMLSQSFVAWSGHVDYIVGLEQRKEKCIVILKHRQLYAGLYTWIDYVGVMHRGRDVLRRSIRHWCHRALGRCFRGWHGVVVGVARDRGLCAVVVNSDFTPAFTANPATI